MAGSHDAVERFTGTVDAYRRWRPSYPEAFLRWVRSLARGARCVDVGSGTGILARQLAEAGFTVTGVEPNDAMRAAAQEDGGATYVSGTAEATGLPDGEADLVTGGQAFHWFDLDHTLPEIDRILAPTGVAVAVWNERAHEGFAAAYESILARYCEGYADVPQSEHTIADLRERVTGEVEQAFTARQDLELRGVLGRAWSASYVVRGVKDTAAFDAALTEAFHRHAIAGKVVLPYRTVAIAWPRQRTRASQMA
jgi:ubiquinone/menaquinone biosynthesis C-methylase UbiE